MLRTSERGIEFIKRHEGFIKYAMWDYAQYSIGYGSHCDRTDFPNGITLEEADELLRLELETEMEPTIAKVERTRGKRFLQCEWDALASLTYNLGAQWLHGRCYQYITGAYPMNEQDFIASLEAWSNAGGQQMTGLLRRRNQEARLYLYGDYADGKPYEKEAEMRYNELKDIPANYRPAIDKLLKLKYLTGRGDSDGNAETTEDIVIDLGDDAVRLLAVLDRAGLFDKKEDTAGGEIDIHELAEAIVDVVVKRIVG